ncbi:MAG: methylamine utilization protein [Planctomycetes bacterium]|nr:methylamine utilization protein [Planctomycetota bacterium]
MRIVFALGLLVVSLLSGSFGYAAEWGDLKLTFVYDGTAPVATSISVNKDPQYCGPFGLVDEQLVVNKENGGIANVIAYIYTRTGPKPAVHPDYAATANAKVVLDNKKCRFEPHVALLRTSQTLVLKNTDAVGHNTNYSTFSNPPQNILIPSSGQVEKKLTLAERLPAKVACNIHPWMTAWLVVQDTPYAAVSNKNGELVIKNLPVGKWTFQFWQESGGYVASVKQDGKATEWKRGRVEITIEPGMNDLGEIKYKP